MPRNLLSQHNLKATTPFDIKPEFCIHEDNAKSPALDMPSLQIEQNPVSHPEGCSKIFTLISQNARTLTLAQPDRRT